MEDGAALLGRQRELGILDGLLSVLPGRGAALLVTGDPGIGKSALLDWVAAVAARGTPGAAHRRRGLGGGAAARASR